METNNNEQKLVSWDKLPIKEQNEVAEEVRAVLDSASGFFKYNSMIVGLSFAAMEIDGALHNAAVKNDFELFKAVQTYVGNHHKLFRNIFAGNMKRNKDFTKRLEEAFTKRNVDIKAPSDFYAALRGVGERIYAKELGISDEECERHIKAEKAVSDLLEALFGKND